MLRKICVLAALFVMTAAPVLAVQATTQINMNMPSLLILYYRSSVTFNISASNLSGVMLTGSNPSDEGSVSISGLSGDAGVAGTDFSPSSATATVQNFWGVRSIANPATQNTQVTVSISGANLSNTVDTITMSNIATDLAGVGTFAADNVTFPPTGLTLQLGDVQFDVDLSGVSSPGSYTGGSILIDAVVI